MVTTEGTVESTTGRDFSYIEVTRYDSKLCVRRHGHGGGTVLHVTVVTDTVSRDTKGKVSGALASESSGGFAYE